MTKTHGKSETAENKAWRRMKTRCYNSNIPDYKYYGAKGVVVCERWRDSFENFLADMGERPSPKHSLDRIDSNGNYEPSNCRWATDYVQSRNQNLRKDNLSGERGLWYHKKSGRWRPSIAVNSKSVYLGSFISKEDAIAARKEAELKYWS